MNEIESQLVSVNIDKMDDVDGYHKDADNECCKWVVEKLSIKVKEGIEDDVESSKITISTI